MKKKLFASMCALVTAVLLCVSLAACTPSAKAADEYYSRLAADVAALPDLAVMLEKTLGDGSSAEFSLVEVYYDSISRGSVNDEGKNVKYDAEGNAVRDEKGKYLKYEYMVVLKDYEIIYASSDSYYYAVNIYEPMTKATYDKYASKKDYGGQFKLASRSELLCDATGLKIRTDGETDESADTVELLLRPLEIMRRGAQKDRISANAVSASDSNKVFTRIMRVETRFVFGEDDGYAFDTDGNVVTKTMNDGASDFAKAPDGADLASDEYGWWSGFGDDISYNWNKTYGMRNERVTVSYNKGKQLIDEYEFYAENIISYYVKNNDVDRSLVLKADVIGYEKMIVDFNTGKDAASMPQF